VFNDAVKLFVHSKRLLCDVNVEFQLSGIMPNCSHFNALFPSGRFYVDADDCIRAVFGFCQAIRQSYRTFFPQSIDCIFWYYDLLFFMSFWDEHESNS
jgi:hypothetical protein